MKNFFKKLNKPCNDCRKAIEVAICQDANQSKKTKLILK